MPTVIDLFCGTGGFSKGFENLEGPAFQTLFGIDLLPVAIETFRRNHRHALAVAGDIRRVRRAEIADALNLRPGGLDVIVGGPPCQGFSSIRPFRSSMEDDPRNTLFEEFASFVNFFRPKYFVIENVIGLATHKGGRTLTAMQECFDQIGYDCDWRILNAANFGVPQRRERLIFIGGVRGASIPFPIPTHRSDGATIGYKDKRRIVAPDDADLFNPAPILSPAVTVMEAIGDLPQLASGAAAVEYGGPASNVYQEARRQRSSTLSLHSSTKHSKKMLEIIKHSGPNISCIPKHLITSGFSSCYSRLDGDKSAVTITVNFVHPASNRCIHPEQDRALTPREGARLQSFDDDFGFAGNRSQITKQIGNAVPPLLGSAVGAELAKCL